MLGKFIARFRRLAARFVQVEITDETLTSLREDRPEVYEKIGVMRDHASRLPRQACRSLRTFDFGLRQAIAWRYPPLTIRDFVTLGSAV